MAMAEKFTTPTILKFFRGLRRCRGRRERAFSMAAAIWLALKSFAGVRLDYMKVVEICGLALVIDVPQKILRIALVAWKGNWLATVSPTLFLANPSNTNKMDVLLSIFDLGDFWWLAVLSVGVSKVASIRYRSAAVITFGIWLGFRIVAVLLRRPSLSCIHAVGIGERGVSTAVFGLWPKTSSFRPRLTKP